MFIKPVRVHRDWGQPAADQRKATRCSEPGCLRATKNRKPFCNRHLSKLPYVEEIQTKIAEAERHDAEVLKKGVKAVSADSLIALEIMTYVKVHGPKTQPRLARELNLQKNLLSIVSAALEKMGHIKLVKNKRHRKVVNLTAKGMEHLGGR